jgi:CBS domain containing-hemolysin-like protein
LDGHWIEALLLILTLILAAMSAAAETALTALSPAVLHTMEEQGGVGSIIAYLRRDPNRFLTTILIVSSTSLIVASSVATLLFSDILPRPWDEVAATVGLSLVVLIMCELVPKNLAVRQPRRISRVLARPVQLFSFLLTPVRVLAGGLVGGLMRAVGQPGGSHTVPIITEDDVRSTITLAERSEGGISEEDADRIEGILDLDRVTAGQVMRPRVDIKAVPADMPPMDALDVVLREGHSRIPVYEESIDRIVGVLYDKDLFRYIRESQPDMTLRELARPAIFVPESKRADELLREFQKEKVHLAIVFDEYGGTAGLVTIEDILEEIVGEIQDEYDEEPIAVEAIGPDEWLVDAGLRVEEVEEELGVNFDGDADDETLGGYVVGLLGEAPEKGDCVYSGPVKLQVEEVNGNRILRVRVRVEVSTGTDDLEDGEE